MADLDVWSTIAVIFGISACLALPVAWLLAKADEIQRPTIPVPWQPLAQLLGDGDTRMTGQKITNGWQPIETAPRDGTRIWLYSEQGQFAGFSDGGRFLGTAGGQFVILFEGLRTTHWRPLPPPPGEGE